MEIDDPVARKRFEEMAIDGRITCSQCFALADELGIEKSRIASTLTDWNIKIVSCQLGCFS